MSAFKSDSSYLDSQITPIEGSPAAMALSNISEEKIKKKKNNKKKKRKDKDKNRVSMNFKGTVIDENHNTELYQLTAGMMYGIRYCVGSIMNRPYSKLSYDDFLQDETLDFPPEGSSRTPSHQLKHTFSFKSYSPKVFHKLRCFYDIDPESYMSSVCGHFNYIEFISNSKSGQFFFYSHDGKYMLKTQTKAENTFMKKILRKYSNYLQSHPYSFLCRILGMHRIEMPHLNRKVHFVVMSSVFDTPIPINITYDLKGSLQGREATTKEKENGGMLKDLDLKNSDNKIYLGKEKKAKVMSQLADDANFLASLDIMDYSLLLGIHNRSSRQAPIDHSRIPIQNRHHNLFDNNQFAGLTKKNLTRKANNHSYHSNILSTPQKNDPNPSDYEETGDEETGDEVEENNEEHIEDYYAGCDNGDSDDEGNLVERSALPTYKCQSDDISKIYGNALTLARPWSTRHDLGINSHDDVENKRGDQIYYMGIIDILQLYNIGKASETLFKSVTNNVKEISSVPPKAYAKRFLKFMDIHFE